MATKQSADERAIRRLIKRHTALRNWQRVADLFLDLGNLWEEEEATA